MKCSWLLLLFDIENKHMQSSHTHTHTHTSSCQLYLCQGSGELMQYMGCGRSWLGLLKTSIHQPTVFAMSRGQRLLHISYGTVFRERKPEQDMCTPLPTRILLHAPQTTRIQRLTETLVLGVFMCFLWGYCDLLRNAASCTTSPEKARATVSPLIDYLSGVLDLGCWICQLPGLHY